MLIKIANHILCSHIGVQINFDLHLKQLSGTKIFFVCWLQFYSTFFAKEFSKSSLEIVLLFLTSSSSKLPPPKDCRFRVPIRTPVRVWDGREAPGKFSILYWDLKSWYPGFFSSTRIWNPGTRDFFYCRVWSLVFF